MQQKSEGEAGSVERTAEVPKATVSRRPEVVDDFIRNFLIRSDQGVQILISSRSEYCHVTLGVCVIDTS